MSFSENVRSAFRRGETDAVVRMSGTEVERAQAAGDPAGEVEARYSLARVALRGGDLRGGVARAREALDVALRSRDRSLEERPRHVLAAVARMSGDLSRARVLYQDSIALNEALDQPRMVVSETHNLALCELGLGNLDVAKRLMAESRERIFRNGWADFVPYVCVAGAALASAEGDHARAARLSGVAEAAFAALGQIPDPDDAADLTAVRTAGVKALGVNAFALERARGKHLDARTALDEEHP